MLLALADFGTPLSAYDAARFADPETLVVLGREPFRVDLSTQIPGVEFASAWERRASVTLDGQQIPLIRCADLIANKKAVGRLQDLADVEALEALG